MKLCVVIDLKIVLLLWYLDKLEKTSDKTIYVS